MGCVPVPLPHAALVIDWLSVCAAVCVLWPCAGSDDDSSDVSSDEGSSDGDDYDSEETGEEESE